MQNVEIEVVWGALGNSSSLEIAPFDQVHMNSY